MISSVKTEDENTEVIDRIAELAAWLARNKQRKRGLRCPDEVPAKAPRQAQAAEEGSAMPSSSSSSAATAMEGPAAGGVAIARE